MVFSTVRFCGAILFYSLLSLVVYSLFRYFGLSMPFAAVFVPIVGITGLLRLPCVLEEVGGEERGARVK